MTRRFLTTMAIVVAILAGGLALRYFGRDRPITWSDVAFFAALAAVIGTFEWRRLGRRGPHTTP